MFVLLATVVCLVGDCGNWWLGVVVYCLTESVCMLRYCFEFCGV